ncbi:hypothetical protein Tco_0487390 [Tanacetum coccineum]
MDELVRIDILASYGVQWDRVGQIRVSTPPYPRTSSSSSHHPHQQVCSGEAAVACSAARRAGLSQPPWQLYSWTVKTFPVMNATDADAHKMVRKERLKEVLESMERVEHKSRLLVGGKGFLEKFGGGFEKDIDEQDKEKKRGGEDDEEWRICCGLNNGRDEERWKIMALSEKVHEMVCLNREMLV